MNSKIAQAQKKHWLEHLDFVIKAPLSRHRLMCQIFHYNQTSTICGAPMQDNWNILKASRRPKKMVLGHVETEWRETINYMWGSMWCEGDTWRNFTTFHNNLKSVLIYLCLVSSDATRTYTVHCGWGTSYGWLFYNLGVTETISLGFLEFMALHFQLILNLLCISRVQYIWYFMKSSSRKCFPSSMFPIAIGLPKGKQFMF